MSHSILGLTPGQLPTRPAAAVTQSYALPGSCFWGINKAEVPGPRPHSKQQVRCSLHLSTSETPLARDSEEEDVETYQKHTRCQWKASSLPHSHGHLPSTLPRAPFSRHS